MWTGRGLRGRGEARGPRPRGISRAGPPPGAGACHLSPSRGVPSQKRPPEGVVVLPWLSRSPPRTLLCSPLPPRAVAWGHSWDSSREKGLSPVSPMSNSQNGAPGRAEIRVEIWGPPSPRAGGLRHPHGHTAETDAPSLAGHPAQACPQGAIAEGAARTRSVLPRLYFFDSSPHAHTEARAHPLRPMPTASTAPASPMPATTQIRPVTTLGTTVTSPEKPRGAVRACHRGRAISHGWRRLTLTSLLPLSHGPRVPREEHGADDHVGFGLFP